MVRSTSLSRCCLSFDLQTELKSTALEGAFANLEALAEPHLLAFGFTIAEHDEGGPRARLWTRKCCRRRRPG